MKKLLVFVSVALVLFFVVIKSFAEKQGQSDSKQSTVSQNNQPLYAIVGGQEQGLTPFPNNQHTRKIIARTNLEQEAFDLAKKGFYERAIVKYQEAMRPEYLNSEDDKGMSIWGIINIYKRQGRLEEALRLHQEWYIDRYGLNESNQERKEEILTLIRARDAKSSQPIYNHIRYLRKKYEKYVPFKSLDAHSFGMASINDIIHLYNWMGDADGGIKFMNEILSSKFLYPDERREFERVKVAFEEDKRTGQKGHLAKVIETSDYIGW